MASSEEILEELLERKGWAKLLHSQQQAYDNGLLKKSVNYVIIAPTASGKTGIAELAMLKCLKEGRRVAYLVPLSSLINDKLQQFNHFTDEYTIYPKEDSKVEFKDAGIVLMTFENFYRNALIRPDIISTFGLVVVDEFHVLYDNLRGFNLEKVLTIIKLYNIRVICLSATFENRDLISEWLNASIIFIPKELRAVELKHSYIDLSKIPSRLQVDTLFRELENRDLYPAIIFCHKRQDTQSRAEKFCSLCTDNVNSLQEVRKKFSEILGRITYTNEENSLIECIIKGIAFHHSGLRREVRSYIEHLFRNRKLKYLFATTGLAYGVNFPARTVVLFDVDFWNFSLGRQEKIPVYMYLQMAGRAGRPQYDDIGYAYIVAKDTDQLERRIPEYLDGRIEEATSKIGNDDFFQKTILELIFSGKNRDEDIISFFKETYYNFLSEKEVQLLVPFNLIETIKRHVETLHKYEFLVSEGAAGYRLTNLGEVSIDFLFKSYIPYELTPFVYLNRYLNHIGHVQHDFNLIYAMFKMFKELNTPKLYGKRSDEIDSFFRRRRKNEKQIGNAEYSSYATYYGWMENLDEVQIEDRFKVHAHPIASNSKELRRILEVYKSLAERKIFDIPEEFDIFCDRIYYGVTEEELPFVRKRGLGRDSVRSLSNYCKNVLIPNQGYSGTLLEILCQLYQDFGEEGFIGVHVPYIDGVGLKRAELILSVIKEELEVPE